MAIFRYHSEIVNDNGESVPDGEMGKLVIRQLWPGMMLSIYKNHERFVDTYFKNTRGTTNKLLHHR